MAKRAAPQEEGLIISSSNDERQKALVRSVKRTSNLDCPNTCSADRGICASQPSSLMFLPRTEYRVIALWRTYPPNTNYGLLSTIHKAPVLDLQWSLFSPLLYSVSADHTLAYTDLTTGQRVRKLRAHREIINSLDRTLAGGAGVELLASASDDGTVRVWEGGDEAGKDPVAVFEVGSPVTCVAWSADGASIYAGALDNGIHVLDLRKQEEVSVLNGHVDTPTGLAISPNGSYLLSPSFSSQVIIHDIRPFAPSPNRIHRVLTGAPAGFENTLLKGAWSREDGGRRVAVGGADRTVTIWDVESSKILYKVRCGCAVISDRWLTVTPSSFGSCRGTRAQSRTVDFHPNEPISEKRVNTRRMAPDMTFYLQSFTASKDGTMLLGEIEPGAP
ncbi:WD40 repeat-like protein [Lactarius akahatsu]|uniref:WD40 repeat-like protein n=1 Tax=Lactarius akahatsu TaxID=416441 RepID=A0AAD4Q956_9AGAM|nr:WD40 repeat-like protein [Lactarius akahatsu]